MASGYFVLDLPEESVRTEGGSSDLRRVIPLPIPVRGNKIIGYFIPGAGSAPKGFKSTLQWDIPANLQPRDVTGEGLTLTKDDPPAIMTLKDGYFCAMSEKFRVSNLYELFNDVTARTGKIDVNASVKCHGTVSQNAEISSAGDVEVAGLVEEAVIKAKGSIIAKGGIAGGNTGKLIAGRDIFSQFVQQATLEAPGNIVIAGPVMNSTILCGKSLQVRPPGLIVGGHVRVRETIEVDRVGSEAALKTEIDVGANPFHSVELEKMQETVKYLTEEMEKTKISLLHLQDEISGGLRFQEANLANSLFNTAEHVQLNGGKLSDDELEKINKFGSGIMRTMRMREELKVKKHELQEQSDGEVFFEKARIKIARIAHPGTIIRIRDAVLAMDREYERSIFYYKENESGKGEIDIAFMQKQ